VRRRGELTESIDWASAPQIARFRLQEIAERHGGSKIAVMLSPFLACEEAFLLASTVRDIAPDSVLVLGPVPLEEQDEPFPAGAEPGKVKFTISREKCPNRRGIEALIEGLGGPTMPLAEFLERGAKGEFAAVWLTAGYPQPWVDKEFEKLIGKVEWLVVQDMFPSKLTDAAHLLIPSCAFAERSGSFMNAAGKLQVFEWAIKPPEGCMRDGQFFYELAGQEGLYNATRVIAIMGDQLEAFSEVWMAPEEPVHQH
jgi:NADH-quinone oxidoreductase subunit G